VYSFADAQLLFNFLDAGQFGRQLANDHHDPLGTCKNATTCDTNFSPVLNMESNNFPSVIPAQAGTQPSCAAPSFVQAPYWMPAWAGMTMFMYHYEFNSCLRPSSMSDSLIKLKK
jgi:hypothetical protein